MNANITINRTLERANSSYHEAAECITCRPGVSMRNAIWTSIDRIAEMENPGIVQYYDGQELMMLPFAHSLVIGGTGTGKSEVFNKNQLEIYARLPYDKKPSVLVTDLKGDIHQQFGPRLREMGYEVIVCDTRKPYQSARYNFLTQIYDDYKEAQSIKESLDNDQITKRFDGEKYASLEQARNAAACKRLKLLDRVERAICEIAHISIQESDPKNKSWCDGARTMFQAIVWAMLRWSDDEKNPITREMFTISNVCRIAFSTNNDCEDLIEWLRRAEDVMCVRSAVYSNYKINAKVTRDGYISSLNTPLGEYTANAIEALTATSDEIVLRDIASSSKPYAIFIITDDRQKTTNNICMMFINDLINELIAAADSSPTHSLSRDFVILADEFANMPQMPGLSNKITTLRSRRIWMVMSIQSLAQLEMVYGNNVSTIIQDNCDIQIFLGSNNHETKEAFARSMGERIGVKSSISITNDGNQSINKVTENVPVVRKSDLDLLELGEFYVRSRVAKNFKAYMLPHFMQRGGITPGELTEPPFRDFEPSRFAYDLYKAVEEARPPRKKFDFDF